MATSKPTGVVMLIIIVVAAVYFAWTAASSTQCASAGVDLQTRTTYAPFEGCIFVDGHGKPDSVFTSAE